MRISDWSSDVCSSDLWPDITGFLMIFDDMFAGPAIDFLLREAGRVIGVHPAQQMKAGVRITLFQHPGSLDIFHNPLVAHQPCNHEEEIGRASCRERVCQYV